MTRDFAFVVDRAVKAADIVRAAQNVDRKLIAGVSVFDVYEGPGIDAGKKSVAIAVTIQPRDKTMTEAEIDALAAKIVAEVAKRAGGTAARIGTPPRLRTHLLTVRPWKRSCAPRVLPHQRIRATFREWRHGHERQGRRQRHHRRAAEAQPAANAATPASSTPGWRRPRRWAS